MSAWVFSAMLAARTRANPASCDRTGIARLPVSRPTASRRVAAARQPVDDDGQQHNDDTGGQGLSEACGPLVGRHEDLASDIVKTADDSGDDDHGQAGQYQLVNADKDLLLGAGKLDMAEALPRGRPGHGRYLAKFLWHRL